MRVCVVGTGYVGLVTGVCLAHIGHNVMCIDNDSEKVSLLKTGKSPIYEPQLNELIRDVISASKIEFSTDLCAGVKHGEIIFIAVGTPQLDSGKTDVSYVENVASQIGGYLNADYKVIINKSTVPIGSASWVKTVMEESFNKNNSPAISHPNFDVISNPEFLREGSAVYDTLNPDRIVIGGSSQNAIQLVKNLYQPIIERNAIQGIDPQLEHVPVLITDSTSAEMIKYAANSFLVTKVSFANEIANICDYVGADINEVTAGIGLDSRIGKKFLKAGVGWGGSCFPKDMSALIYTANEYGYEADILKAAIKVNRYQRLKVIVKLQEELKVLMGKTIGILGLTFKPNTDDLRDAPALDIIDRLQELGARVKAYDPMYYHIKDNPKLSGIHLADSAIELAEGCHALILVTDWPEFLEIDYSLVAANLTNRLFIDGRNFLDKRRMTELGFTYIGIGQ
jgi:UDPglucose 6-dehydrogenase